MSAALPQQNLSYAELTQMLKGKPIHVARSFEAEEVLKGSSSLTAAVKLPQTGIPQVDNFMGKTNAAVDVTLNSITDIPKAALKGGLSGGAAGTLVGIIFWAIYNRSKWGAALCGGLALGGAALGSVITTSNEIFHKIKKMKDIVLY